MSKEVLTCLPDSDYHDLYKLVKRKGRHVETFCQDTEPTTFWISNGHLYSRLKGSPYLKKVLPISKMPTTYEPASGLGKALDYLMKKHNRPINEVLPIVMYYYSMNQIPKSVEIPQEILDEFQPPPRVEEKNSGVRRDESCPL